jgi:6-phosphogluconate dehydrogenase
MSNAEFGMIGLGTMGRALLQNIADHGFTVSGWNRSQERLDLMLQEAAGMDIQGFTDLEAFVQSIRKPRVVMLLVPAGEATDEMIERVLPLLEPGDFIIDGSNAYYRDTDRRSRMMADKGFGFLGLGVSGGESGARYGPSMMAGGTPENYERVRSMLEAAAAKYHGEPCVALLGPSSAGHYVKMVHNGIEYGIMQVLAECYDLMRRGLGMKAGEIAEEFALWNDGHYKSFLLDITVHALRHTCELTDKPLVDCILDKARAKGTGKWTSQDAMDLGVPIPTIDAAVRARELSALKSERVHASTILASALETTEEFESFWEAEAGLGLDHPEGTRQALVSDVGSAMRLATIACYAQGLAQLRAASLEHGYDLDLAEAAKVWRAGCIIRSELLEEIRAAFAHDPALSNLLIAPHFAEVYAGQQAGLRRALAFAVRTGIPTPAISASLAYIDSYRTANLPANLIQAQRDLFGAHTYERHDRDGSFHTEWGFE